MVALGSQIVGVEDGHADNAGLACLLVGLPPLDGGRALYDLTGKTAGAALQGGAAWAGTPHNQQGLRFANAGDCALVADPTGFFDFSGGVFSAAATVILSTAADGIILGKVKPAAEVWELRTARATGTLTAVYVSGPTGSTVAYVASAAATAASVVGVPTRVLMAYDRATLTLYVNGRLAASVAGAGTATSPSNTPLQLGRDTSNGGTQMQGVVASAWAWGGVALSAGAAARDYEWSQDPDRDPRFRRTSTRSLFVTAAGVPAASFVPAFAPGWGW